MVPEEPLRIRLGMLKRRYLRGASRRGLQALAAVRGIDEPPSRPVFVVGCPRSGTSLLWTILKRHEGLSSLPGEGHVLWSTYQHPRVKGWRSDRATVDDIRPGEARFLYTAIERMTKGARFLDKTPKSVLRIPYLAHLFPDATFVFLKRDGRSTVNSLIEGWRVRHGVSYRVPQQLRLDGYSGHMWSYILPEGWREWSETTIADIAAFQYASSYDTALLDLTAQPPRSVVEISYEDLIGRPVEEVSRLLEALELAPSSAVMEVAGNLSAYPVVANSPPRPEKWRDRADEISRIMPRIAPTMERLGYAVRES
jgi:LPS sulfotransferase NodH